MKKGTVGANGMKVEITARCLWCPTSKATRVTGKEKGPGISVARAPVPHARSVRRTNTFFHLTCQDEALFFASEWRMVRSFSFHFVGTNASQVSGHAVPGGVAHRTLRFRSVASPGYQHQGPTHADRRWNGGAPLSVPVLYWKNRCGNCQAGSEERTALRRHWEAPLGS